jgi:hypothetical protein
MSPRVVDYLRATGQTPTGRVSRHRHRISSPMHTRRRTIGNTYSDDTRALTQRGQLVTALPR